VLLGATFVTGPVTWKASWSRGTYENPGGHQRILVLGLTLKATKNVDLLLEYVEWKAHRDSLGSQTIEDGVQVLVNWSL
jgi:hypothetical protein